MKIALIGATGNVGTRLISELRRRGYQVTAIARHPEKLDRQDGVNPAVGDVQNENALAAVLAGHDVAIHSVKFLSTDPAKVIAATKAAKVPRLLVVGGAGSLEVAPGLTLVNSPDFPPEYKPETLAGVKFLEVLRREEESIGRFYLLLTSLLPANAPASSDSVKTSSWLVPMVKAAYPRKTLRSRSWTSWSGRNTLANDSRSGTDGKPSTK
jgi:putative NADH-flavin reductase